MRYTKSALKNRLACSALVGVPKNPERDLTKDNIKDLKQFRSFLDSMQKVWKLKESATRRDFIANICKKSKVKIRYIICRT